MDALKRLEEKNKQHQRLLKKQNKWVLPLFLFSILAFIIYLVTIWYVADLSSSRDPERLPEMTRHLWLLSMILTVGLGSLFVIKSFTSTLCVETIAQRVNASLNYIKVISIALKQLLLGLGLIYLGIWLDDLITANRYDIAQFFRFGFSHPPLLLQIITTGIIVLCGTLLVASILLNFVLLPKVINHQVRKLKHKSA
ncbi:hypothetical protein AB6T38_04010 [Aliiglaciecola sp. SL4]|uniref:hypothetical protein n=1 Tax=Aliiglaciecola sp. SL4 TaxID=3239806 RepID=UPI00355BB12F